MWNFSMYIYIVSEANYDSLPIEKKGKTKFTRILGIYLIFYHFRTLFLNF